MNTSYVIQSVTQKLFPFDDVIMMGVSYAKSVFIRFLDGWEWKKAVFVWLQKTITNANHAQTPCITMTSQWAWWRLRSPASRLFNQPFIRVQIIQNIKATRVGNSPGTGEFPAQMANNADLLHGTF